jgi:hypothetical protein
MQFDGARHVIERQMPEADLFALIEKTTERAPKKIGVINQTPLAHQLGNTRFHSPIEFLQLTSSMCVVHTEGSLLLARKRLQRGSEFRPTAERSGRPFNGALATG